MLNLNVLDTLIAIVVVMLVLSLIVQSVQGLIKKLLHVKSLQLEQGMVHLFHYALDKDASPFMQSLINRMPMVRAILSLFKKTVPYLSADGEVKTLYTAVETQMLQAGRVTMGGKVALDSVSKADLLKFIGNIPVGQFIQNFSKQDDEKFASLAGKMAQAQNEISEFSSKYHLLIAPTPAAQMVEPLTQMLAQASQLFSSGVNKITLEDMAKFGGTEIKEALKLLDVLPDSIRDTIAQLDSNAHQDAANALRKLHEMLIPFSAELKAIAWLPTQLTLILGKADFWYGTIMQSFEERYARSMKSVALALSFIVVVALNANLFGIYRQISTSDTMRNLIVQSSSVVVQKLRDQQAAGQLNEQQANAKINELANESLNQIKQDASLYTSFGFSGPQWIGEAWENRGKITAYQVFETLLGWLIMTALLSVGAPFWQDVLESLFGLKNLLRKQPPLDETK